MQKISWRFAILTMAGLGLRHIAADCPNTNPCSCYEKTIDCAYFGSQMPAFGSSGKDVYTILSVHNTTLTTIDENMLSPNLETIYLSETMISNISSNAFAGSASTLTYLSIWGSQLTELPDALLQLKALEGLEIGNSPITVWNMNILKQLGPKLKKLFIGGVGLSDWPAWMTLFTNVEELGFYNTPLNNVPNDAFDFIFTKLTYLDIYDAGFTSLPNFPAVMPKLNWIGIYNSFLTNLSGLPQMPTIRGVDFGMNNLSDSKEVMQALMPFSSTISDLYLDDNPLGKIPDLAPLTNLTFANLANCAIVDAMSGSFPPTLQSLDLSNNSLPSFPDAVSGLPNIKELNLHGNLIKTFISADIPATLQSLDMSVNNITMLADSSFPVGSALDQLYLDFNPLDRIGDSAFDEIPYLARLDLSHGKLTRLPIAARALLNLEALLLNDNPDIICTCKESALATWYQSHRVRIEGLCGKVSIGYFLYALAPGCPKT